ncbi:g9587 [Coccomyxa viridis]|uniref:G9587 protein n=1 Tax=Coccomyxa viridis TaxID=1274662 RepID=A0ABP1G863_9CHLO
MAATGYVLERLSELREEAYCKVLRCFLASQQYDLGKELMLSKLRTELCIADERHEELRQRLDSGEERPWVKSSRGYVNGSSEDGSEPPSPAVFPGGGKKRSGLPGMGDRPLKKRLKKSSAEPDGQAGLVNGKGGRGVMGMNPLIGHKVDRLWAEDNKWWSGIITDFNIRTGEHCICYMVGTEEESFEWLDVDKVPNELRILQDTVDVLSLPRPGEAGAGAAPAADAHHISHPPGVHSRGGGGGRKLGGRGRGSRPGYHDASYHPPAQRSHGVQLSDSDEDYGG